MREKIPPRRRGGLGEVLHARGEHVSGFNGQLLAATCTSAAELACKQAKAGGAPLSGAETNYRGTPPVQLEDRFGQTSLVQMENQPWSSRLHWV